jgi:hypothetical protein
MDFNPANGLIRHAWETVAGIPDEAFWHDNEMVNESISGEYGKIQPKSITRNSQIPKGQPSKINFSGGIPIEWDSENFSRYIANLQRKGSVTNPSGSAYRHKLAPSESAVSFPDSLSIEVSRDDGIPQLSKGARVNSLKFSLSPEGFFGGEIGVAIERGEYWDDTDRIDVLGGAEPTYPFVRGLPNYTDWNLAAADGQIRLKVSAIAGGVITFLAKLGTAAYGATTFDVTVGNDSQGRPRFYEIINSNTALRMGTRDLPVEVHVDAVANYVVNQEFSIQRERPVWTPVYADCPKFNEIYAKILLGSSFAGAEEYEIDAFDLTVTRPAAPKHAIGGRHAKRVKVRGQRAVTGTLKREYISIDLRKRLERAESFWLVCNAYDGEVISGGIEGELSLIAGLCVIDGKTPSIGGQDSMDENYNFSCHPSGDATYPDDVTIVNVNTQASLALGT